MHLQIETATSVLDRCAAGLRAQMSRLARSADNITHAALPMEADSEEPSTTHHNRRDVNFPTDIVNMIDAGSAFRATVRVMKRYVEMEDELLDLLA